MSKELSIYNVLPMCESYKNLMEVLDEQPLEREQLEHVVLDCEDKIKSFANSVVTYAQQEELYVEALSAHIKELSVRKQQMDKKIENARKTIFTIMKLSGITKIKSPTYELSIVKSPPKVNLLDEVALLTSHPEYFIKQDPRLDRARLLKDLKLGELAIDGAELVQDETLKIR